MTVGPRRLHHAVIVVEAMRALRDAAVPLIVALVIGVAGGGRDPSDALTFGVIGVTLALAVGYRRWTTTTWWVSEGALHFRRGLFSSDETVIPKTRIQSVDTSQNPLERLLGVLELHVQTAGGANVAEVVLTGVAPAEAELLRKAIGRRRVDQSERRVESLKLGAGALMITALTAPQLGVLLPLLAGLGAVGDDVMSEVARRGLFEQLASVQAVLVIAGATLALAWALSIIGAVIAFSGFTVERDGESLRIRRGLAQRRAATLPLDRVHAVRIVEGVLRQPFGLVALRMETAGYRGEPSAAQTLFPLLKRSDVDAVLSRFVPELAGALGELTPPPRRALKSYLAPAGVLLVVLGAFVATAPETWPGAVIAVGVLALHGVLRHRAAGWRLTNRRVVLRSRFIARQTLIAHVSRLQEHGISQTVLQRRTQLASVDLAVGSGTRARVAHLEGSDAADLLNELRPAAL